MLLYTIWGTEQADEVDSIAKDDILFCVQTEYKVMLAIMTRFSVKTVCNTYVFYEVFLISLKKLLLLCKKLYKPYNNYYTKQKLEQDYDYVSSYITV